MEAAIELVLRAGHSAVDVALYTLLPIMVVMMIAIRSLEAMGFVEMLVKWSAPIVRPFGLTGLSALAMVQLTFVSFVAPLPTLALMEDRGISDRRLAAGLAGVLAMAPANASFPLMALGLRATPILLLSVLGGFVAASVTFWLVGLHLSDTQVPPNEMEKTASQTNGVLNIINVSGAEAIRIVTNIIPMLLISLVVVYTLQTAGIVDAVVKLLTPALQAIGLDRQYVLTTTTKYLAGGTALVGLLGDMEKQGQLSPDFLNRAAGFLIHPLDLPGIAILTSAGPRTARVCVPALCGAAVGILTRSLLYSMTG